MFVNFIPKYLLLVRIKVLCSIPSTGNVLKFYSMANRNILPMQLARLTLSLILKYMFFELTN